MLLLIYHSKFHCTSILFFLDTVKLYIPPYLTHGGESMWSMSHEKTSIQWTGCLDRRCLDELHICHILIPWEFHTLCQLYLSIHNFCITFFSNFSTSEQTKILHFLKGNVEFFFVLCDLIKSVALLPTWLWEVIMRNRCFMVFGLRERLGVFLPLSNLTIKKRNRILIWLKNKIIALHCSLIFNKVTTRI